MNFLDGYYKTISRIRSKAARAELSLAILEYHYDGIEPEFKSEIAEVAFEALRWSLDNSKTKSEAGKSGASKREENRKQAAKQAPSKPEASRKQTPSRSASKAPSKSDAKEEEEVKETPPKGGVKKSAPKTPFSPPSIAEVAEYAKSRETPIDAERFCDYYASNGWKVGRNPMKDWRAAVRTWANRDRQDVKGVRVDDELRSYDQEL